MAEGVALQACISALASFGGVPGRLERINMGQPFSVFVDFTVTPLAYEKTLKAVRAMTEPGKRVMVLTGACGNRMREKRPVIGKLCSELADVVIVTTDETQTESPQRIIDEVWSGVDTQRTQAHRITDRREAIAFLLRSAQPGDSVALCGMGACQTMQTQTGLIPWDEREIAREELRKAGYTK
jgi:UDP-N-acetylmuramoyl-L-alanyl-D-glutamate--2,6-diaminopimelate ligase